MIAKTGLLVLTNPVHIGKILPTIRNQVKTTLYIHLTNALHEPFARYRPELFTSAPKYNQTIRGIYSEAAALCENLDVRVLLSGLKYSSVKSLNTSRPIDIVFFDKSHEKSCIDTFLNNCLINKKPDCSIFTLENNETLTNDIKTAKGTDKNYRHVVLGGTFDRLHVGHKILLNEAVLCATEKVTVGVTDTNMLSGKILWELVEPITNRLEGVKNFLNDICPELSYNIVPIQDPFGPTQSDPTMELIVVSAETLRGGEKVNEIRQKNNLTPLEISSIELIDCHDCQADEETKISSSTNRMRLLGTLLKEPKNDLEEKEPYVIGLTGGIASGKSSVSMRLANLGAVVIDCDKIAHELYQPGKPCHKLIHEAFGDSILDQNGEVNRKALGAIVFGDKSQLARLNSLVWPAIACEVQSRIDTLRASSTRVVVIEAAVLVAAGWQRLCHEVWSCIVPADEAIRRLQERNGLSEEDAKKRMAAQPSNVQHVAHANVVLCTLWSREYTQLTVERAWKKLGERMAGSGQEKSKI